MDSVLFKNYRDIPVCEKEILRYAGCRTVQSDVSELLKDCLVEVENSLKYQVCYRELEVNITDDKCDFGVFSVCSASLAKHLCGCKRVIVFAATIGFGIDRLITKYSHILPARGLMLQAIGAERIEALCNTFCNDIEAETSLNITARFSPGYGDVPLEVQRDIFSLLNCDKYIGISLNNSLLMSPSKSVTAFVGIGGGNPQKSGCELCTMKDCNLRGVL